MDNNALVASLLIVVDISCRQKIVLKIQVPIYKKANK